MKLKSRIFPIFFLFVLLAGCSSIGLVSAARTDYTAQESADAINNAASLIDTVDMAIEDAEDDDTVSEGAINGAKGKLTAAKNNLATARKHYQNDKHTQAYNKAKDSEEKAMDSLDHLLNKAQGNETDDIDESDDIIPDENDIDDPADIETPSEDERERMLYITVKINGQDVMGTTQVSPLVITGNAAEIEVEVENRGNVDEVATRILIVTSTRGIEIDRTVLAGGTLTVNTSFKVEYTIATTGTIFSFLQLDPGIYATKVTVDLIDDIGTWDYEMLIYWEVV